MHEPIRVRVRLSQILFAAPQPLAAAVFRVTAVVYESCFIELAEFGEVHRRVAIEKENILHLVGRLYDRRDVDVRNSTIFGKDCGLHRGAAEISSALDDVDSSRHVMTGILENGTHQPSQGDPFFTEAFFIDPLEIRPFMAECGAVDFAMFGAEGMMAQSEDRLAGLSPEVRQGWLELAIETAATPGALYVSEHIVFVGRKPN